MPQVNCQICSKDFYVKNNHLKRGWGKYCSIKCRNKSQIKGKTIKCKACGKSIFRSLAQLRHSKSGESFCSKSCYYKKRNSFYAEDKHPRWTNGESSYRDIMIRNGLVKKCARCNLEDTRILVVHHIDHNRKNNNKSNLISVCHNCHYLIHYDKDIEDNFKTKMHINMVSVA